jgi:aerobic-type carbon monoxide dehydrogenase small subunit (CoxS/CutS family)
MDQGDEKDDPGFWPMTRRQVVKVSVAAGVSLARDAARRPSRTPPAHRVNACLTLAIMAQGKKITTIEGLSEGDRLHPMQAAFLEEDGFQCGYCTPGQIMSAVGLIAEGKATSEHEVREHMSGNICRCGAYPNIVRAVLRARKGA